MQIRHVLLSTDLSPESLQPCLPVADLARQLGARITLLHVVQEVRMAPHGAPLAPAISPIDVEEEVEAARKALVEQAAELGVEAATEVVTGPRTHEAVVGWARRHDVDLIALSTHGRTGFRHLALGSVAEAILRHSPIPVLCFPRPKR